MPFIDLDGFDATPSLDYSGTRWHLACGAKKKKKNPKENHDLLVLWLICMLTVQHKIATMQQGGSPSIFTCCAVKNEMDPTWHCSQQLLWIILSSWVMISVRRHCCWVFQVCFLECHLGLLYSKEGRRLYNQYISQIGKLALKSTDR